MIVIDYKAAAENAAKIIGRLERELQVAKAEWAAWKDVATLRGHLIDQVKKLVEHQQTPKCRHPVLIDSTEQPGVDIYVCGRCDAEVRINDSEVRRAPSPIHR